MIWENLSSFGRVAFNSFALTWPWPPRSSDCPDALRVGSQSARLMVPVEHIELKRVNHSFPWFWLFILLREQRLCIRGGWHSHAELDSPPETTWVQECASHWQYFWRWNQSGYSRRDVAFPGTTPVHLLLAS